jgi:hypothetical protein
MASGKQSASPRFRRALLGIAVSSSVLGVACNAILGIQEGHLVIKKEKDAGSAGSSAVDGGNGGSSRRPDASSTGGSTAPGSGGTHATGGSGGTGESDSGSGGSTASGGRTGTGGRGGTTGGSGGAATGGSAGMGGSTGVAKPPGVKGQVHCGNMSCVLTSQICCVETTTGDAHCAASCDSTSQLPVSCDGSEDCTGGKKCCYPTGGTTASCMATCLGRVFCGSDRDCAAGQRCAPGTGALATVFVCVTPKAKTVWCGGGVCDVAAGELCCYDESTKMEGCAKSCPGPNVVRFACDSADDCASGSSCCETKTGIGYFTGTDCVAGGCPSGVATITCGGANGCTSSQQCCLAASGTSCAATCSGDVACGTDADCPTGQSCTVVTDTTFGKTPGVSVCATP